MNLFTKQKFGDKICWCSFQDGVQYCSEFESDTVIYCFCCKKQLTADDVWYPKSERNNTLFQGSIHTTKANFCCREMVP